MKNLTIFKKSTIVTLLFFLNISCLTSQNLYELYETSFHPPASVQQYVNSYLSGGVGLNPYDYTQLETYCIFNSPSGKSIKIFGFYYEDRNKTDNGLSSSPEILIPNGVKMWKIRFTPNEVGNWNYRIYVSDKVHKMTYILNSVSFNCTKSAINNRNSKGFIRSANSRYLKYETGQPYYPIGNSCYSFSGNFWDQPEKGTNEMKAHMNEMSENKINFFRFEINHFGGVNLFGPDYSENQWPIAKDTIYYDQFNQHDSWQLDYIINYANSKGIDLWLTLFAHSTFGADGNYCDGNGVEVGVPYTDPVNSVTTYIKTNGCGNIPYSYCNWALKNPFNVYMEKKDHNIKSSLTGSCNSPYDFFDINNTEAIKVQRNLIKYIIARWGYATNILAFELMDEANIKAFNQDNTYPHYVPVPSDFDSNYVAWNHNTYDFIKSIDCNNHLITSAFAGDAFIDSPNYNINNKVDFTQGHYYFDYTQVDPEERFYEHTLMNLIAFHDKPFIIGEFGYWPSKQNDPRVYELHNALWSTFFNGAFGSASFWEYDYLSGMGVLSEYKGISNFLKILPQFSGNYNRCKTKITNGLRSYYLKSNNGYQFYGWAQDVDYIYNSMYVNMYDATHNYINVFPTHRPSVSSITNRLMLQVSKNAKYEVKWYATNTGECVERDILMAQNSQLELNIPPNLLGSEYADAGFSVSCKPSIGWVEKQTCPTQWNLVMPNSKLAINDIGSIIYINSNRRICGFWKAQNDNNWSDAILSDSNDTKVLNGSNALLWSTINNCIYYIGEDQKIYKLFYSGSSWHCQLACSSQWNSVLATSALTECSDGSLLYVNVNKEICTLYISGGSMLDGIIPTTRKALNGKGLVNDPLSYATTYYVGSDYKIWKVFYTSNGWQNQQVCPTQSNVVRVNSELVTGESSIFYVNSNNKLCILYKDGGIYYDAIVNNTINIKSNSQLSHGEYATVYFIGTDNNIYKEFYSSAWKFTALNQSGFCQESANLNILTSTTYGIYYSGLSDNMVHDFAYNSILKSSEIVDNNSENVNSNIEDETKQYKVYPNPISKENGKLFIDCHSDNCNPYISIYNIYGQLVKNTRFISNGVDLSDLNPGMYMIMFDNGNSVESHKLIIEN